MMRRRDLLLTIGVALAWMVLPGTAYPQAANEGAFCFVQITDTHFGSGDHAARTQTIVDRINNLPMPIACAIHTGDLVSDDIADGHTLGIATAALARIHVPVHVLPGNHDILRTNLMATLSVYTNRVGPLCSRAEHNGVVFLLFYNEPLRKNFTVKGYDALAWLEAALKEAGNKPVIVCLHSPPVEDFYDNRLHRGWKPEYQKRFVDLVNAAPNVKAVLAGHFHRDELHWLGRVPLYVSSSVAGYWGRQGSFRVYEYRDGRLSYRTVYLEPPVEDSGD